MNKVWGIVQMKGDWGFNYYTNISKIIDFKILLMI